MAKYYDDTTTCEQQSLLHDDDSSVPNLSTLGVTGDEPATFCVRCRSLSSLSPSDNDANTQEWINSLQDDDKCEPIRNGFHSGSCRDGSDLPLLTSTDGSGTTPSNIWSDTETTFCHTPVPLNSSQNIKARNQLLAATLLCLIFMVAEAVGGYLAGSLAVQTDAAHLLSDLVGFGGSLMALWLSKRPSSRRLTYGWARAEPLAALASVLVLWCVTAGVGGIAVHRLLTGESNIDVNTMIIVAGLGVIINIVMGLVLHGGCNGFEGEHGHSHGLAARPSSPASPDDSEMASSRNINVRAAVIHVVGDLVQSIGVLVAAVVIKFCPSAIWADPACTILCCVLVLLTSAGVARDAVLVLLEACPSSPALQPAALAYRLAGLEGVLEVMHIHVWSLTPGRAAMTAHLIVGSASDGEIVIRRAQKMLRALPELEHITLQTTAVSST